jgi:hypothetical protein
MPFLVKSDFKTHLYAEVIAEITRDDDTIIDTGIKVAVSEAKSYLSRYDLLKIFGEGATEPTVSEDKLSVLKDFVKDIACWKIVKLCNANVDLKLFKTLYDDAILWLTKVQKGGADPEGWPYKVDDSGTPGNENTGIQWSSNVKRTQHY